MKATVVNFRRGRHTQNTAQLLLAVEGVDSRAKASHLVGKKVVWTSPARKEIHGKITSPHGNKGIVRVRFSKGLPGDVLGKHIQIKE